MVFAVLFTSLFVAAMIVFFAFFPVKAGWIFKKHIYTDSKPAAENSTQFKYFDDSTNCAAKQHCTPLEVNDVYDDPEL